MALLAAAAVTGVPAHADPSAPATVPACTQDLDGTMTLLPDEQTYAICQPGPVGFSWSPAPIPFEPHERWWSYGPQITLHGQGFRNPNLTSGPWTATPLDDDTRCGATQVTVIEPGVLAPPVVTEADPQSSSGQPLNLEVLPKLFTIELTGHCLWTAANGWLMP